MISSEGEPAIISVCSRAEFLRKSSASLLQNDHEKENVKSQNLSFHWGSNKKIILYYVSAWENPYCHYTSSLTENQWSELPGCKLAVVSPEKYTYLLNLCPNIIKRLGSQDKLTERHFESFMDLEFVFNNDGILWDKPSKNSNYLIKDCGQYLIYQGVIHLLQDPPENPVLFRHSEVGPSHVTLKWSAPITGSATVASYNLYRDDTLVQSLNKDTYEFKDTDLLNTTDYNYHICAINYHGARGRSSDIIRVTTSEPGKPGPVEGLRTVFHSRNKIEISWQRPLDQGGAPIKSYLIFRNGDFMAAIEHSSAKWQSWEDTTVKSSATYRYHVIPTRIDCKILDEIILKEARPPIDAEISLDETFIKSLIEQKSILTMIPDYGQICEGLEAKAVDCIATPKFSDNFTHIILQAFNWDSCYHKPSWFRHLAQYLEEFKKSGITIIWLPPASESVSPQGYMPTRWYNLNSAYGTEVDLLDLIDGMRAHKIIPMLDFVVNHRCGVKQDKKNEWTIFEDPPWESWAIVKNNLVGYTGLGQSDTGAQSICAPDIDHINTRVRHDIKQWLTWLFDLVGFGALRIDMAPGYAAKYQIEYVNNIKAPFTIAEYWSGDSKVLMDYIHATRQLIGVYDFALYYVLKRCIKNNDFTELRRDGRLPGIIGEDRERAVTFIENHDTAHLDFVGKFADGSKDATLRGLVYILTHPGTPCIFWDHFVDPDYHNTILFLCNLRREMSITSRARVCISQATQGLYAAYIAKDTCPLNKSIMVVKLGTRDWSPPSSEWKYRISGEQFCIWTK